MSELSGLWKYQNNPASAKSAWSFRVLKVDAVWKKKADLIPPFSALFNPVLLVVLCRWVHLRPQRHQVLAGEGQGSQSHDQRNPRAQKPHAQPHAEDADPETCRAEEEMSKTVVTLAWPHVLPCRSNICIIRMYNTFFVVDIFHNKGGGGGVYTGIAVFMCLYLENILQTAQPFFDQTCLLLFFPFFFVFSVCRNYVYFYFFAPFLSENSVSTVVDVVMEALEPSSSHFCSCSISFCSLCMHN